MSESLSFSINGEFLTNTARTWFWDENKSYETCEKLLLNCLINPAISQDQTKQIAQDILEYRQKLTGDSATGLYIEPDPGPVRPITEKLNNLQHELKIERIRQKMDADPLSFVDPYSTVKSLKAFKEGITRFGHCHDKDSIVEYFTKDTPNFITKNAKRLPSYKAPFWCGLWLFDEPEFVLQICEQNHCNPGTDIFWEAIYKATCDQAEFQIRNQRYLASVRTSVKNNMAVNTDTNTAIPSDKDDLLMSTDPDDLIEWQGLIDPAGHFYSCGFGGHNVKAYNLITHLLSNKRFPELTPSELKLFHADKALDILVAHGWCATRYLPGSGNFVTFPTSGRITSAQRNTIWDAIVKHQIHLDYTDPILLD